MSNPAALSALAKGDIDNFRMASTPGAIESQEKAGQALLVASSNMPKDMSPNRETFERVGFVFGEPADELFLSAKLPPGWTRAATDHSRHSDVLDEQGRKRVSIFYKAAFYDRRAKAYLVRRFQTRWLFPSEEGSGLAKDEIVRIVADAGKEIHRFAVTKDKDYAADTVQENIARAWMAEHYPDNDPNAYWNEK